MNLVFLKEPFTEKLNSMTYNFKKKIKYILIAFLFIGCGNYSFTGASIPPNTKTFQVNLFDNIAGNSVGSIFEPGLDRDFTLALQNIIENQTNLQLTKFNGDLVYSGDIVEYRVSPMSATKNLNASQNRLTIGINVSFENNKDREENFDRRFSFYYDFDAQQQLVSVKNEAHKVIFERITQDIFNATLAKW